MSYIQPDKMAQVAGHQRQQPNMLEFLFELLMDVASSRLARASRLRSSLVRLHLLARSAEDLTLSLPRLDE